MLPKKNRANTKDIDLLFKGGKSIASTHLTFKFLRRQEKQTLPRISVIAPKAVAKLAVTRNLLRRKAYSILKKNESNLPTGTTGVFIFKKYQDDTNVLENEIKNIFDKIN